MISLWLNRGRHKTSLREGEIITIIITNDPLIGRWSISINMFTSTISSQTLVHLLYPILYPKPQIGTGGLLVQVRAIPNHRSTHISNYQSTERESYDRDEN